MTRATFADQSTIARLIRRGIAQRATRERAESVLSHARGFVDDPEVGPVLQAMVRDFGDRCRAERQVPIVVLIQDAPGRRADAAARADA